MTGVKREGEGEVGHNNNNNKIFNHKLHFQFNSHFFLRNILELINNHLNWLSYNNLNNHRRNKLRDLHRSLNLLNNIPLGDIEWFFHVESSPPKNTSTINIKLNYSNFSVWIPGVNSYWIVFKRPEVMSHFGGQLWKFANFPNLEMDPFSVHPSKFSVVLSQLVPDFPFDVPIMPSFSTPQSFGGWFYPTENIGRVLAPKSPKGDYTV